MSHVNILAINPRFALIYGEKRKEAGPDTPFRRLGGELFVRKNFAGQV
jgi:hypothetical protein